jgi:hypothetical protein
MFKKASTYRATLWFRRWSRRADAAFVSIGKVVHIGTLKVDICRMAMLKSGVIGIERMLLQVAGGPQQEDLDPDISEHEEELLQLVEALQVAAISTPAAEVAAVGYTTYNNPTSNGAMPVGCGIFRFLHYKNQPSYDYKD